MGFLMEILTAPGPATLAGTVVINETERHMIQGPEGN